jgi:DNA-binding CsgD family transcriptional regulator
MITYSNKAPSEMKGIIEMRKLKERALNLDGPFMRSVLSPMQRDLLAYAIVDGFSLEDIALLLDLNIKVIRKLVNSAFDDRDAIEEIAAEGVGLGEDNNPVGKEYDDSERRSRRDRERRDTRRGSRNRKGEDSGVFGPY